jgi:hypothetical protein
MATMNHNDNIPNIVSELEQVISAISDDEVHAFNQKIIQFIEKYKTEENINKYNKEMSQCLVACSKESTKYNNKMDEILKKMEDNKSLQDKLKLFINGTYECIKINMKNPDFDIKLPIDNFTDEEIHKLLEKGIITENICMEEINWRKIIKTYPTNDSKQAYIMELEYYISLGKKDINDNINTIRRINIVKNNVYKIKYIINDSLMLFKYNKKYNLNEIVITENTVQSQVNDATDIKPIEMKPEMTDNVDISTLSLPPLPIDIDTNITPSVNIPRPKTPPLPQTNVKSEIKLQTMEQIIKTNIAIKDIFLEKFCQYGNKCIYINNPKRCGFNHTIIGEPVNTNSQLNKIKKGDIIPSEFCKFDKPWNSQRCHNLNCCDVHCVGRVQYVMKYNKGMNSISNVNNSHPSSPWQSRDNSPSFSHGHANRDYSPVSRKRNRSLSPVSRKRNRSLSPVSRERNRSPVSRERNRSRSPVSRERNRSRSPVSRERNHSSVSRERNRSRSPVSRERNRSLSPVSRERNRSPVSRERNRSRSPVSSSYSLAPTHSVSYHPVPTTTVPTTSVPFRPFSFASITHPTYSSFYNFDQTNTSYMPYTNDRKHKLDNNDLQPIIDLRNLIQKKST